MYPAVLRSFSLPEHLDRGAPGENEEVQEKVEKGRALRMGNVGIGERGAQ